MAIGFPCSAMTIVPKEFFKKTSSKSLILKCFGIYPLLTKLFKGDN